jgi:ubiquitin carboxyl-terminal hydrolase 4/11/15
MHYVFEMMVNTKLKLIILRYLIDSYWYKQLRKYLGLSQNGYDTTTQEGSSQPGNDTVNPDPTNHPGPVDNTRLFKENATDSADEEDLPGIKNEIRDHMIDELDYVVVPQEGWTLLIETFGTTTGQEPVARKVVEHGMFVKHCKVEVYKVEFLLAEHGNPEKTVKKRFSKADTLCKY